MTTKFLRFTEMLDYIGNPSRQAVYVWMAAGSFPAPIKLGGLNVWPEDQINGWLNDKIEDAAKRTREAQAAA